MPENEFDPSARILHEVWQRGPCTTCGAPDINHHYDPLDCVDYLKGRLNAELAALFSLQQRHKRLAEMVRDLTACPAGKDERWFESDEDLFERGKLLLVYEEDIVALNAVAEAELSEINKEKK